MTERRYLVQPGWVVSANDGQRHWLSASRLADLYGLRPEQWRTYDPVIDRHSELPVLRPRYYGNYALDGEGDE